MTRYDPDDPELGVGAMSCDDLPLFAIRENPRGIVEGMAALERTSARAKNAEMIDAMVPIAQALARTAVDGITVTDLRKAAVVQGLLTGTETGKTLSYLGSVMKAAGLVPSGATRRSTLTVTHGIRQTVWLWRDTQSEAA